MSELNKDTDNTNQYNSEFSYDENKSNLKISFERITFIFFVFFIIAIIFSSKVILLSLQTKPEIRKISKKENFRASILDKEGNILAKSVPVVNLGINPNLVINKEKLLISLKILFPKKNFKKQMYGKKFFYVKKKIHPEKLEKILLLGDKSFIEEDGIAKPKQVFYKVPLDKKDGWIDVVLSIDQKNKQISLRVDGGGNVGWISHVIEYSGNLVDYTNCLL